MFGVMDVTRALLPQMRANGGGLIGIFAGMQTARKTTAEEVA